MIGWLWAAWAVAAPCVIEMNGEATEQLDCAKQGAWRVRCDVPPNARKLRAVLSVPARRIEAEAPLPRTAGSRGSIELPLMGPTGRSGAFIVKQGVAGLLPGQAVGPMQLCPVVQPGVEPGSPPRELALEVRLTAHQQTGFAEEELDGGVRNRVPVYDQGSEVAVARAVVRQLPVKGVPILTEPLPMRRDETVGGELRLRQGANGGSDAGGWVTVAWSGRLRDREVATGDVVLLVLDFDPGTVALMADGLAPARFLEQDLLSWLEGSYDSLLGLAAWRRSDLEVPVGPTPAFEDAPGGWRRARLPAAEVWVGPRDEALRVVIGQRATPFDEAARAVVRDAR